MEKRRIIINADDFGIDEMTSLAIADSFKLGFIDSASLIVNSEYTRDAVKMSKEKAFSDRLGLHLNLTEGNPLLCQTRCSPNFVGPDGKFFNNPNNRKGIHLFFMSSKDKKLIGDEIKEQVLLFESFQIGNGHFDSHHHIHTVEPIWRLCQKAIKKSSFKVVRISRNLGINGCSFLVKEYKKWFNRCVKRAYPFSALFFGSIVDYQTSYNDIPNNCDVEIMVHPVLNGNVLVDAGTGWKMSDIASFLGKTTKNKV